MPKNQNRLRSMVALCLILSGGAYAADPPPRNYQIPPQPVSGALKEFAAQSGLQLIFTEADARGARSDGVTGTKSAPDALQAILKGTGLEFELTSNNVVVARKASRGGLSAAAGDPSGNRTPDSTKEAGKTSSQEFRVAEVDQAPPGTRQIGQAKGAPGLRAELEEVVVTAQKREERLQDVPVPVTAVNADTLLQRNELRLQDYSTSVPGLSVTQGGGFLNAPTLAIRGITTGGGGTNPTVAVVVDDVPYGPSSGLAGANQAPDLDPSDLARVEVLRGPQGTVYGSSSIGGLIKFVTVDPSTKELTGRVQVGVSDVYNGAERGYNARGAVNVPVTDTLALRLSGFTRQDPGYIDDPINHLNGVNEAKVYGGRLSALFRPSDVVSLKVSALLQHQRIDGSPEVDKQDSLGDLQQNRLPGTGWYNNTIQAYSATLTAKLGPVSLTSLSGYNVNKFSANGDFTYAYGPFLAPASEAYLGIPNVAGTTVPFDNRTRKFTQEIRASAPINGQFEWLLGVFYTHENTQYTENVLAADSVSGTALGTWANESFPTTFTEYAVFGDLTWHINDRFDVQLGGRESKNRQSYSEDDSGPLFSFFYGAPEVLTPKVQTSDNSFTYLLTPRFKITPDVMVYARLASGYRTGGPNANYVFLNVPPSFAPDKTQNYELGVKGTVLEHALSFDASLYYIDWKNIQLSLIDAASYGGYVGNASGAKSQGIELSLQMHPLRGLSVSGWFAFNDAVLTHGFPSIAGSPYGASGDRLPFSSRLSGELSVQEDFPVTGRVSGFAGGSLSYVGDRLGGFTPIPTPIAVPPRQNFPGYARVDLRAGAKFDSWELSAFVTNLADRRALSAGGIGTDNPAAYFYIQPRTAGLSLTRVF